MSHYPMRDNIYGQPASLRRVLELHAGEQRATLLACAEQLRKADGRIVFSGMGASFFAALPAVTLLEQAGYRVQAAESGELLHYGSAGLRPADLGILISRSGQSVEVLRLAEKMRAIGMRVIGVTNMPSTSLEAASDLTLLIGSYPDQLIAVQTYTGTVLALLLLVKQVLGEEVARLGEACAASLPSLAAFIEQSFDASDSWREVFDGPGALYLLGRGPAIASAHEGALLLHETAKAAAVSISSGQFRHGPVEVVSQQFRAVIFGTPALTQAMDRSLANDLRSMGAIVRWIGPALTPENSRDAQSLITWPVFEAEVAPMLASLFEIVPLQMAAYQLALWRKITPGDFYYASEITSEESGFPFFSSRLSRA